MTEMELEKVAMDAFYAAREGNNIGLLKELFRGVVNTERRKWRRMAQSVAMLPKTLFTMKVWGSGTEFLRASSECPCLICTLEYREHPGIPHFPTFHVICNGTRVKL